MPSPPAVPALSPAPARRAAAAAVPLLAATLAACGGGGGEVAIALAGPLDQGYGQSTRLGADLALKEINAEWGGRRRLVLVAKNDYASGDSAVRVASELAADRDVVAVAGHVNSGTTMAASRTYEEAGLPAVATTATSPLISRLGDWIFRVASSDSANAVALARTAHRISPQVGILYVNDDYGQGLAGSFRAALVAAGGSVAEADPFLDGTEDFGPYLRRMQQRGVRLVFIAGLDAVAGRIIRQARALGLEARFIGGDGLEPLAAGGGDFDGTLVGVLYHAEANPQAQKFAQAFRSEYRREPDSFAAAGYDAVRLLAAAIEQGGASREAVQAYLREVGAARPAFEGATGTIRFDANGDPREKAFTVGVIQNGTIQLYRDAR